MPPGSQAQVRSEAHITVWVPAYFRQAAPEDIILGPPKTAFASANSRNAQKSLNADVSEDPPASNKRFSFHERLPRDRDVTEGEKRDGRHNGTSNRRGGKDDREDWQNSRQRRHHDQEEGDGRPRRTGDRDRDRPRWDKESRDPEVGVDTKRLSRDAARRDGRGKFDQPWFRGDKAQDGAEDATKAPRRQNEWRRDKGSGRGAEWDRPSKTEQDPEWMDSTVSNEPRQAHTQEEFQRWKESMKAGAEGRDREPEKQEMVQQPEIKRPEPPPMPAFLEASEVESGMDRFFASYDDRKTSSTQKPAEVKSHRKPRFAALFSPQPEDGLKCSSFLDHTDMAQTSSPPAAPVPAAPVDANIADQEHFQRVLQMLAGRSSNNTPQSTPASKPVKNTNNGVGLFKARAEPKSPHTKLLQEQDQEQVHETHSQNRGSAGISGPLGVRPLESQQGAPRVPTPNGDADLLLRLMQQTRIAQDSKLSKASQTEALRSATELSPLPGVISQQLPVERLNNHPPAFFDDPAISQVQRPEQAPRRDSQQRRPTNGPLPTFFDEPFFNNLRQAHQQPTGNTESIAHSRAPTLPPGMQRPPGFDPMNAPLPSWPNQPAQRSQQQGLPHNGMNPPPGIPTPATRALHAAYASGPSMPLSHVMQAPQPPQQQMPPTLAQHQRQRKYTGGDSGPGGYPHGMAGPASPLAFMNSPPPPGFPNLGPPLRGVGGTGQQQFTDGNGMLPRHLMDMLAGGRREDVSGGGGGSTAGGGMPGHYR